LKIFDLQYIKVQ